jgi:DNA replication protein DnaC
MAKNVEDILDFTIVQTDDTVDCAAGCGNTVPLWIKRSHDGKTKHLRSICDECERKNEYEIRALRYRRLAPPFLLDSDETRFPNVFDKLKKWNASGFVYLYGKTGKGKTRMAIATLKRLILNDGIYAKMTDSMLGDRVAALFRENINTAMEYVESIAGYGGVLLMDDLDKNSLTERSAREIWSIIDHRYKWALPTVITTQCELLNLISLFSHDPRQHGDSMARRIYESAGNGEWILEVK